METAENAAYDCGLLNMSCKCYDGHDDPRCNACYVTSRDCFLAGVAWADRWIPVGEELPEKGALSLVRDNRNVIELAVWNGDEWQCEKIKYVTHWRPIEHIKK